MKNTYEVVYEVPFVRDDAIRRGVKRTDWEKHRTTVTAISSREAEGIAISKIPSSRYKIVSVTKVS